MLSIGTPASGRAAFSAAMQTERLHSMLRRMPDEDWRRLKDLMGRSFGYPVKADDIEVAERLFRRGESLSSQAGGMVLQVVQAMSASETLLNEVRKADERMKARVRWVLREMSEESWGVVKAALARQLTGPTVKEDIRALELVFRLGESVSNVEIAAQALAQQIAGRKPLAPEVARRNALLRVRSAEARAEDPEAVYAEAKEAFTEAEQVRQRGPNTLAYRYVAPTAPFKHARSTLFKVVDAILEDQDLRLQVLALEQELAAVPAVSREQMRWALHRMPARERLQVLKLVPLNTILMFQELSTDDVPAKATRDRRLAYDLFIKGESEEQLVAAYGLSVNALKNAVGEMLDCLTARPLARKPVLDFLTWARQVEPMEPGEVRRRLKQLTPDQRASLLKAVPNCAWKVREVIPLHKHLFLDYLSGEWVLGALVNYYNLHKNQSFAGRFNFEGTLTVRGANAAVEGLIRKLAEEPVLRERLQRWTSPLSCPGLTPTGVDDQVCDPSLAMLMPPASLDGGFEADLPEASATAA